MLLETFKNGRWRYVLMLFGLLGVMLFPFNVALADGDGGSHNIGGSYPNFGTVWYGPKSYKGSDGLYYNRYGVVAFTKYDAAIYCCMGSDFEWDDLSNKKKSKLYNDSSFNSFANLFTVGKPSLGSDWSGDSAITLAWNSAKELYGETYCFNVTYSDEQRQAAINAIRRILAEDDTGSGGAVEGVESSDSIYWPATQYNESPRDSNVGYLGLNKVTYQSLLNLIGDSKKSLLLLDAGDSGGKSRYFRFLILDNPDDIEFRESSLDGKKKYYIIFKNDVSVRENGGTMNPATVNGKNAYKWSYNYANTPPEKEYASGTIYSYYPIDYYAWAYGGLSGDGGSGGGGDVEPPEPWPAPPSKPVGGGPDVPEPPTDPTVPTPPTDPDPEPPTPWDPIPDIDIDITGEDFQDLIDALNEHCIHLQNSIQTNVSQLWDLQSSFFDNRFSDLFSVIQGNLQWLGNDVIVTCFTDLKDYLHDLFEWLSEKMDFNVNVTNGSYDDTSVVYWLKQIWAKMGDGINTQPTDPVTEPDDWWAWLLALMGNFVAMLLAFGADRLGDVSSALQTLTGKFPFSLPWDLAAMFALLDAPAVTPAFDLPCFAVTDSGLSQVSTYHITLEGFNEVWEGVRWVERVGFAVMLIRSTDFISGIMRRAVGRD